MSGTLIVYQSRGGHTSRVTRRLMETLHAAGSACEMMDIVEAQQEGFDWDKYDTVIVGCPVLYGDFDKRIKAFIAENQDKLEARTNGFFCLSVVARNPVKATVEGNRYIQKFLAEQTWKPQNLKVFAGKVDYPSWGFFDSLSIKLIMKMTKGPTASDTVIDYTDWNEVEAFGLQIHQARTGDE
ncbi:menaquinone-dependent protoporphyrinogen IX dehydrogenase [Ferrimonas lipolytica]|uniref:Protoporphyrinogen IX dehydrogenase [quinone] n=1 Tax=Ferrimonas lipolytica TaxID=2724191 RepID=A0A6H1UGJ0_9GAMM|nr:menaquinone-dependent protoporphyrinogen IX dehydrogenase [Ferrimonas lipolytica]QIZ78201.1 menaquinone-dependent protoporphyrinogen IX dehydrogenase [Ferrimonas lipolytica]